MQKLVVHVFYEPGAAPFVGNFPGATPGSIAGRSYWDVTRENLKAVFLGRPLAVTIEIPDALNQMTALPAQNQASWTNAELEALWKQNRTAVSSATEGHLFLVFLDGYLERDGAPDKQVIGVSLSGTPITAIFKRVVESTGQSPTGPVPKFVEQSTIVHEVSHALGLVNNGIPPTTSHQDTAHGAHCTNTACAMYWENEGLTAAVAFAQQAIASGSLVLLKSECLDDTSAFRP